MHKIIVKYYLKVYVSHRAICGCSSWCKRGISWQWPSSLGDGVKVAVDWWL